MADSSKSELKYAPIDRPPIKRPIIEVASVALNKRTPIYKDASAQIEEILPSTDAPTEE